jgi:hypothetical protein
MLEHAPKAKFTIEPSFKVALIEFEVIVFTIPVP